MPMFCKAWSSQSPRGHDKMAPGKVRAAPQATLSFVPDGPPIFDYCAAKPQSNKMSWPGQMWNHLANVFSPSSLQWVNPHLVRESHHPVPPEYTHLPPYPCHGVNLEGGLWHPAVPGNVQQVVMDPLLMFPPSNISGGGINNGTDFYIANDSFVYPNHYTPDKIPNTTPMKVPTKPLNPNAQEWVPLEYQAFTSIPVPTSESGIENRASMSEKSYLDPSVSFTPVIPYSLKEMTKEEEEGKWNGNDGKVEEPVICKDNHSLGANPCTSLEFCDLTEDVKRLERENEKTSCSHHHNNSSTTAAPFSPVDVEGEVKKELREEERKNSTENSKEQSLHSKQNISKPLTPPQLKEIYNTKKSKNLKANSCPLSCKTESLLLDHSSGSTFPDRIKDLDCGRKVGDGGNYGKTVKECVDATTEVSSGSKLPGSVERYEVSKRVSNRTASNHANGGVRISPRKERIGNGSSDLDCEITKSIQTNDRVLDRTQKEEDTTNGKCDEGNRIKKGRDSVLKQPSTHYTTTENDQDTTVTQINGESSDHHNLSYAGVLVQITPSPPLPQTQTEEQIKYKGVEQPLPKIFQRDRTPPKESVNCVMTAKQRTPEFFRLPSKSQRTRSRKFLQELKEVGQKTSDGGGSVCGSTPVIHSPSPSIHTSSPSIPICSISISTSSAVSTPSLASPSSSSSSSLTYNLTKPCSVSSDLSCPTISLSSSCSPISPSYQASPVNGFRKNVSSTGSPISLCLSESPNRTRSSSESSVEFLDLDEVDRGRTSTASPIKTKASVSIGPKNGFLACILGSGDSESEDEDDDWDGDWDDVCFAEPDQNAGLDDFGTFGLGLVIVECRTKPPQMLDLTETKKDEQKNETTGTGSSLSAINERWEREVARDVKGRSSTRVQFGAETVHPMVAWGHAYRQARCGPWEEHARDRARFQQRIATLEPTLARILNTSHRRDVYSKLHTLNTST